MGRRSARLGCDQRGCFGTCDRSWNRGKTWSKNFEAWYLNFWRQTGYHWIRKCLSRYCRDDSNRPCHTIRMFLMADFTPDLKRVLRDAGCRFDRKSKGDHEIWYSSITMFVSRLTKKSNQGILQMRFLNKPDCQKSFRCKKSPKWSGVSWKPKGDFCLNESSRLVPCALRSTLYGFTAFLALRFFFLDFQRLFCY